MTLVPTEDLLIVEVYAWRHHFSGEDVGWVFEVVLVVLESLTETAATCQSLAEFEEALR